MKQLSGGPGTVRGLFLRIGQFSFASVSYAVMLSASHHSRFSAFSYLLSWMGFQILWSLGLVCLDVYALWMKPNLQISNLGSLFVIGDLVSAILSLSAACSSAGVMVLLVKDSHFCRDVHQFPCSRVQVSIASSFITWFLNAISALVSLWIYSFD